MVNTSIWHRGFDVTALTLVTQTVNPATGVVAASVNAIDINNFLPVLDEFDFVIRRITENVSPLNTRNAHHFRMLFSVEATITEILRNQGTSLVDPPKTLLANIWHKFSAVADLSRIVQMTYTRAGNTWTGYMVMTDYTEPLARTKNVAIGTFRSVDVNSLPDYA